MKIFKLLVIKPKGNHEAYKEKAPSINYYDKVILNSIHYTCKSMAELYSNIIIVNYSKLDNCIKHS